MLGELANIAKIVVSIKQFLARPPGADGRWSDQNLLIQLDPADLQAALSTHLESATKWASSIPIVDPRYTAELEMDAIFIEPELVIWKGGDTSNKERFAINNVLQTGNHRIILGYPGAGKTTLLKHLCNALLTSDATNVQDDLAFPIVIRVRDLQHGQSIVEALKLALDYRVAVARAADEKGRQFAEWAVSNSLLSYVDSVAAVVLIDGLDEVAMQHRLALINDIRLLMSQLHRASVIVTARTSSVDEVFASARYLYIEPFDMLRIKRFVKAFFGNGDQAAKFLKALSRQPYSDAVRTPLHLGNLCLLYKEYGSLPEQPLSVYRRVINLRLEQWDRLRGVRRRSTYARFDPEQKRAFLGRLSFEIARKKGSVARVNYGAMHTAYREVCTTFGLPSDGCRGVLEEIESHTGVLVQAGFEEWEFAHKSLQEFLTAEQIAVHPNKLDIRDVLLQLPDECAISTGICSDPAEFFSVMISDIWRPRMWYDSNESNYLVYHSFWRPYVRRLVTERVAFAPNSRMLLCALCALHYHHIPARLRDRDIPKEGYAEFLELVGGFATLGDFLTAMRTLERLGVGVQRGAPGKDGVADYVIDIPESIRVQQARGLPESFSVSGVAFSALGGRK